MAKPATLGDSEPHRGTKPPRSPFLWSVYPAMGKTRRITAMLVFVDDLLLNAQPARERVEFAPPFESQAIGKLLMIEAVTEPTSSPTPDLCRNRLPSGARRNLPCQTVEMPLDFAPGADCLRQRF